ncbi:MAG: helix-turn-helix domain-containing protein [Acidobacteria bacterium]|nr:helix-turn-helix domain-containing protein [Acidobacteriota bacterium]
MSRKKQVQSAKNLSGAASAVLPLKAHRQRAGVTLEQISEATKISRRFLEVIEDARFAELPGGVFSTSYIRQYACATGYDAELILERYRLWCAPAADAPEGAENAQEAPKWGRFALFG